MTIQMLIESQLEQTSEILRSEWPWGGQFTKKQKEPYIFSDDWLRLN